MNRPSLKFIADSMYQEMDFVRRHFDEFSIAELEYALRILEGEASQLSNFIASSSKKNYYLIDTYTEWEDFNEEMMDRISGIRICVA